MVGRGLLCLTPGFASDGGVGKDKLLCELGIKLRGLQVQGSVRYLLIYRFTSQGILDRL